MMQQIKQPDLLFVLTGDIYRAQRQPGSTQLLINQDYKGITLLDVWKAQIQTTIPFPATYNEAPVIDGWCLRADGGAVVIFNEEQQLAAYLPLETDEPASLLPLPALEGHPAALVAIASMLADESQNLVQVYTL